MKALANSLKDNLTIRKNTNKHNYLKLKEIKENIEHLNNIKVIMLFIALLLLVLSVALNMYILAIVFGSAVVIAYFGLNIFQKVIAYKTIQ